MKSVKGNHFDSIAENLEALFGERRFDAMIHDTWFVLCTHSSKDYALRKGTIQLYAAFHRAVILMSKPTSLTVDP